MQTAKYYDHRDGRPLNMELDGCTLDQWAQLYGKARFARHPKGFNVFLSPDKIAVSDEYASSDPYTVEQNIEGDFHKRRIELTIDLAREAISSTQNAPQVLDLGCGQGFITDKMSQALPSAEFTGLDYSVSAIEYAHEHFPRIDFAVGDAYESPYADESFDVVVCNNLWEHVPDPLFLLGKIRRLLKPNGYLIVSTPSRYRLLNLVRILRGKPVDLMSRLHVTEYTVGQVVEQLSYGKFQVKRVLSRPISLGSLKADMVRKLLASWISLVGSHHQLEGTVFYLAQKTEGTAGRGAIN